MKKKIILSLIFISSTLFAKMDNELISVVKVKSIEVFSKKIADKKYLVETYAKGKVLKLDWCDRFDWCKIKDKELFISKAFLGVMEVKKHKTNTPKVIEHLIKTLPKKDLVKKEIKTKKTNKPKIIEKKKAIVSKPKCIKLKQIDLDENELFTKDEQDEILKKHIGKCIDGNLLKKIITEISDYYLDQGYITTKPYLKAQDITDGQIDINILKGKVEDIVHSDTNSSSWKISTAFIGQKDVVLNLRDLETSLEMVNRVGSADSKFELKPGKENGSSIVEIKTKKTFPMHLSLGYSGSGTPSNNDKDITGILIIDNPLGINDILVYTYNGSRIQQEYQSSKGKELNYSFPIGSYVINLTKSESTYRQGVQGINAKYLSNGKIKGTRVAISKVLTRNQTNKLEAKASIYIKDTKNYFEHELIEVSSYKTTLFQIDLMHTNYQPWGQNYTVYSFYQGKDWFGAMSDVELNGESDYSDDGEKLEFTKYSINNTLYYYLKNRSYRISSNAHIQYSKDMLYSNDQLTVGSAYTVRGYDDSNYYGNTGYYIKNDFTKTFSPNLQTNLLNDISFFIGLDGGYVRCESVNTGSCGELYGKSIGFSTSSNNLSSDFTWSRPIKSLNEEFEKHTLFNFNINLKF